MKKFQFNTGVRPFSHTLPAGMAFMKGFENSGNGVYVIPFYCDNVPDNATFKHACDQFIEDTNELICKNKQTL